MKPFHELTKRGRDRRLRQLALNALRDYPIDVQDITLIANEWNCVFRVDAKDGAKYAMRVCVPHYTLEQTRSEMTWMTAIRNDTNIPVPKPLKTRARDLVTVATAEGVPEPRQCVIFSWLNGATLNHLTPELAFHWGVLSARLHQHALTFTPPPEFTRPVYDKIFPFNDERAVMFDDAFQHVMTNPVLFRRALDHVQAEIDRLFADKSGLRVIHCDLHQWNVMQYRKRLSVIDFEDVVWGYPVQDVGASLHYVHEHKDYPAIRSAFKAGYCSQSDWIEHYDGQLDTMMIARALYLYNLNLDIAEPADAGRLPSLTAYMEKRLVRYLETGKA
jgi:Ser/Thr protein kinase RdoA (MazF antagonist)